MRAINGQHPDTEERLVTAIQGRNIVEFNYDGLWRVCEPHVFGELRGVKAILAFQIDGFSNSGLLPDWRRFNVNKIRNLVITPERFKVRKSSWDTVYEGVKKPG